MATATTSASVATRLEHASHSTCGPSSQPPHVYHDQSHKELHTNKSLRHDESLWQSIQAHQRGQPMRSIAMKRMWQSDGRAVDDSSRAGAGRVHPPRTTATLTATARSAHNQQQHQQQQQQSMPLDYWRTHGSPAIPRDSKRIRREQVQQWRLNKGNSFAAVTAAATTNDSDSVSSSSNSEYWTVESIRSSNDGNGDRNRSDASRAHMWQCTRARHSTNDTDVSALDMDLNSDSESESDATAATAVHPMAHRHTAEDRCNDSMTPCIGVSTSICSIATRDRPTSTTSQVTAKRTCVAEAAAPVTTTSTLPVPNTSKCNGRTTSNSSRTSAKTSRYLREMDRRDILARIAKGEQQAALAKEYNISRSAVCNLHKKRVQVLARSDANPQAKHPKAKRRPKPSAAATTCAIATTEVLRSVSSPVASLMAVTPLLPSIFARTDQAFGINNSVNTIGMINGIGGGINSISRTKNPGNTNNINDIKRGNGMNGTSDVGITSQHDQDKDDTSRSNQTSDGVNNSNTNTHARVGRGVHSVASCNVAPLLSAVLNPATLSREFRRCTDRLMRLAIDGALEIVSNTTAAAVPDIATEAPSNCNNDDNNDHDDRSRHCDTSAATHGISRHNVVCAITLEQRACPMLDTFVMLESEAPVGYARFHVTQHEQEYPLYHQYHDKYQQNQKHDDKCQHEYQQKPLMQQSDQHRQESRHEQAQDRHSSSRALPNTPIPSSTQSLVPSSQQQPPQPEPEPSLLLRLSVDILQAHLPSDLAHHALLLLAPVIQRAEPVCLTLDRLFAQSRRAAAAANADTDSCTQDSESIDSHNIDFGNDTVERHSTDQHKTSSEPLVIVVALFVSRAAVETIMRRHSRVRVVAMGAEEHATSLSLASYPSLSSFSRIPFTDAMAHFQSRLERDMC